MTADQLKTQIAHIDQWLADIDRKRHEHEQAMRLVPWQIAVMGMTMGAMLFAAGMVVAKVLLSPCPT